MSHAVIIVIIVYYMNNISNNNNATDKIANATGTSQKLEISYAVTRP